MDMNPVFRAQGKQFPVIFIKQRIHEEGVIIHYDRGFLHRPVYISAVVNIIEIPGPRIAFQPLVETAV